MRPLATALLDDGRADTAMWLKSNQHNIFRRFAAVTSLSTACIMVLLPPNPTADRIEEENTCRAPNRLNANQHSAVTS